MLNPNISSSAPPIMSLPSFGFDNDCFTTILSASALVILAVHLVPYVVDTHGIRSIPGPWLAKFTDAWLGRVAARGHRSEVVHEMHKEYGEPTSITSSATPCGARGLELTHAFSPFLRRNLRAPRSKPRVSRRPRRPPSHLRSRKRKLEERLLRRLRLHPQRALQHP